MTLIKKTAYGYDFQFKRIGDTYHISVADKSSKTLSLGSLQANGFISATYNVDVKPLNFKFRFRNDVEPQNFMFDRFIDMIIENFDVEVLAENGYNFSQFNKYDLLQTEVNRQFGDSAIILDSTGKYVLIKFNKGDGVQYASIAHDYLSLFWGHYYYADDNGYQLALNDFQQRVAAE